MSKFIVRLINRETKEVICAENEVFADISDAKNYASECNSCLIEGSKILKWAGMSFSEPSDVEYVAAEIA